MNELSNIRSRFEAYGLLGLISRPVKGLLFIMAFFAVTGLIDLAFPAREVQERLNRSHPNNVRLLVAGSFEEDSRYGSAYSVTYVLVPDSIVTGSLYVGYGSESRSGLHSSGLAEIPLGFWLGLAMLGYYYYRWCAAGEERSDERLDEVRPRSAAAVRAAVEKWERKVK